MLFRLMVVTNCIFVHNCLVLSVNKHQWFDSAKCRESYSLVYIRNKPCFPIFSNAMGLMVPFPNVLGIIYGKPNLTDRIVFFMLPP